MNDMVTTDHARDTVVLQTAFIILIYMPLSVLHDP